MADILQDFPIQAPPHRVFDAVSQPALLDEWWTVRSTGNPEVGSQYELDFGPDYLWRATVTVCRPGAAFELHLTNADGDWTGTRVGFELSPSGAGTEMRFSHRGWPEANEHGERVPYEKRLDV